MPRSLLLALLLFAVLLTVGCSSSPEPSDDDDDSVQPGDDDDLTPDDDDDTGDDDDSVIALTLSGEVTRSVEPALDGIGTLRVRLLASAPPNAEVTALFELKNADLSASDGAISYELTGIPVRDEPYQISASLDDDGDGGRPDESDMRLWPRVEVTLDEDVGQSTLDLVLNDHGSSPIPGDDDDSAGDDDDSAGDDDDSAGDDDDSAASGLPAGDQSCSTDSDCASGICWDFSHYDSTCGGTMCSETCSTNADCVQFFTPLGASDPGSAVCGSDYRCDPLSAQAGVFFCQ
jgi:hypothetical protein